MLVRSNKKENAFARREGQTMLGAVSGRPVEARADEEPGEERSN